MGLNPDRKPGLVYTFYSYKGGVGRSMALANAAALLAKWGRSVLVVDWDLEASGIEKFFFEQTPGLTDLRRTTPGIVDLIHTRASGTEMNWRDCVLTAYPFDPSNPVSIISAGRNDMHFKTRVQELDFEKLFRERELGNYIEDLRTQWTLEFDIILVDSRTGITDIGGICTIHLPDVLVLLFTTTESSMNGVIEVMQSAREQQSKLPFDRRGLLALPVPARDESRTEYEKAREWRRVFADRFAELYKDWLPSGRTATEVLDLLRIPYVPFWSFGERLPVVEDVTGDPASLGAAYEVLARLIETDLEWGKVLDGEIISSPVSRNKRSLDDEWLKRHRTQAMTGLNKAGRKGSMEVCFYSPNAIINRPQDELLKAARNATVNTFGWPIGIVLDSDNNRPRPTLEGVVAEIQSSDLENTYDYWALTKQGDFYTLTDLFEDTRKENRLFLNTRIVRTTEALMYCSRLYRGLGLNGNTVAVFKIIYQGLTGRILDSGTNFPSSLRNSIEDTSEAEVSFLLQDLDRRLVDLVRELCEPLFLLFDFQRFDSKMYERLVNNFVNGKVS